MARPRQPVPCGSLTGYARHMRARQSPCPACQAAKTALETQRWRLPDRPAPQVWRDHVHRRLAAAATRESALYLESLGADEPPPPTPGPRGRCRECGQRYRLTLHHTVRAHPSRDRLRHCPGSRQAPAEEAVG